VREGNCSGAKALLSRVAHRGGKVPPPGASEGGRYRVRVALFLLSFYKAYLSVVFAGTCRFEPTCSRYAYEAIERFGVWRGGWLGLRRLLRCHPLSGKFGYDPVPEEWVPETGARESLVQEKLMGETHEVRP